MTTKHMKTSSIVLGALLALGAAGCANEPAHSYAGTKQERSASQAVSDSALSARIKTAFAADDLVKARDIKVDVMRGVVTLNGVVYSAAERNKAISIARNTTGVVEVKDNLKSAG